MEAVLFWSLLITIAWLPVPLGSNVGWCWSLMEFLVSLMAAGWLLRQLLWQMPPPGALKILRVPLLLLVGWLLYHLLQVVPFPMSLLEAAAPATAELNGYLTGGETKQASLSLAPGETLEAFLKAAAYITLFLLVVVLANSPRRLRMLALLLIYAGTANAVYGLANYFTQGEFALINRGAWPEPYVVGTYVNRNHFAGLIEMTLPMALGMIIAHRRQARFYPTFKARMRGAMDFLLSRQSRLYLYAVIMFSALFLSASRGGNIALIAALVVGSIVFRAFAGRRVSTIGAGKVLVLIMVLAAGWFGMDNLLARLGQQGLENSRAEIWSATSTLIADYPLFGAGSGSYEWLFPLYKTADMEPLVYDHAHSDYLELLAEQGVVGFMLLGLPLSMIWWRILTGLRRRRDPGLQGILFGVISGILAMLFHAVADFNFHIPANAAIFWCLMGMGVSAVLIRQKRRRN